jgi:hypothetical protein
MAGPGRKPIRGWAALAVAAAAGLNAGCLGLAIGAAAGGAAGAGYVYLQGTMYRDYPAPVPDTGKAVHEALADLQMPILAEDRVSFESQTADGSKVKIRLDGVASRVPSEGESTHVAVRVGALGDEAVTRRILDQVSTRLVSSQRIAPVAAPAAPGAIQPASLRPAETAPPPVAAPEPPRAK